MSKHPEKPTKQLLRQIREGHESSFNEVFELYLSRLTSLVRSRMAAKLARKIDPEDIVLSAFRSFFVATRNGRFEVEEDNSLWRILVTISLRKLNKHFDHFNAAKRSLDRESGTVTGLIAMEPSPDEAAMIEEELCLLLATLTPKNRTVVELRLQGATQTDIASQLGISDRTVRRILRSITEQTPSHIRELTQVQMNMAKEVVAANASIIIPQKLRQISIDDFSIVKHIGSGGMGKVYFGQLKRNEQPVAIKFLRKRFLNTPLNVHQFLKEAALLQELDHPNIVKFIGIGKVEGQGIFIVMQWIEGVIALIHTQRKFTQLEVANISNQAAEGLLAAHKADILHCDVTPANLLLQTSGKLMISDFGLARRTLETVGSNRKIFGTAAFLSPEQVTNEWGPISPKTDVYGLGATMYYLLAGLIPFPADSIPEMITKVISPKPPQRLREINNSVCDSLEELCMSCLNKEATRRPTMQAVKKRLQEIIDTQ